MCYVLDFRTLRRPLRDLHTAHITPSFPLTQVDPFAVVVMVSDSAAWPCTGSVAMTTLSLLLPLSAALMVAAVKNVVAAFMDTSDDTSCVIVITYVIVVPSPRRRRRPPSTVSTQSISHAPGRWSVQITSLMACAAQSHR